jgi:hypothetical protein
MSAGGTGSQHARRCRERSAPDLATYPPLQGAVCQKADEHKGKHKAWLGNPGTKRRKVKW